MSSHVSVHYKYWLTLVFHFSVFEGPIRECGEVTILLEVWWICQLKSICLMLSDMETKVEAQCLPPQISVPTAVLDIMNVCAHLALLCLSNDFSFGLSAGARILMQFWKIWFFLVFQFWYRLLYYFYNEY